MTSVGRTEGVSLSARSLGVGILLLTRAIGPDVAAQDAGQLAPGARVRVWVSEMPDESRTGTLVERRRDTLLVLVAQAHADTLRFPFSAVTRLDVSTGVRSHVGSGVKYGLLAGAGTGALAGLLYCGSDPGCSGSGHEEGDQTLIFMAGGALAGAVTGLVVGAIVGSGIRTEQWQEVPASGWRLSRLSWGVHPLAVAASLRF